MPATHTDAFAGTCLSMEDHETTAALRHDKVRRAQRRIARGQYDRDDLLDVVLEAILHDVARR